MSGRVRRSGSKARREFCARWLGSRRRAPRRREMTKPIDLFQPVVSEQNLHPGFKNMRDSPMWEPARAVLRDLFREFPDPDGNFVEQFQTSGFDARIFEIYLFAVFRESGFTIDRSNPRLDFLLGKDGHFLG